MSPHPGRLADALAHEVVEGHAARALGDEREHDVAAVAVREALAGSELRRVPVEDGEVLLRRRELVHGDRHQVVGDVDVAVLVQVVADARAVREQVLDGHVVADEREIVAEQERAVVERSRTPSSIRLTTASAVRPFVAARDREPRVDLFGSS